MSYKHTIWELDVLGVNFVHITASLCWFTSRKFPEIDTLTTTASFPSLLLKLSFFVMNTFLMLWLVRCNITAHESRATPWPTRHLCPDLQISGSASAGSWCCFRACVSKDARPRNIWKACPFWALSAPSAAFSLIKSRGKKSRHSVLLMQPKSCAHLVLVDTFSYHEICILVLRPACSAWRHNINAGRTSTNNISNISTNLNSNWVLACNTKE